MSGSTITLEKTEAALMRPQAMGLGRLMIYSILQCCGGLRPIYLALALDTTAFMVIEWFSGHNFVV